MKRTPNRIRSAGLTPPRGSQAFEGATEPLAKAYCRFSSDWYLLLALISRDIRLVLIQCAVVVSTVLAIREFF